MSMVDGKIGANSRSVSTDQQGEPERLALRHIAAAEGEKLLHQVLGTLPGREDCLQMLPCRGSPHLILSELGEADDRREDVVEVMGDAACQRANGFHLLRLRSLGFEMSVEGRCREKATTAPCSTPLPLQSGPRCQQSVSHRRCG